MDQFIKRKFFLTRRFVSHSSRFPFVVC
jgi:hypothetical protein